MKRPIMSRAFNVLTGYAQRNAHITILNEGDVFRYGPGLERIPELTLHYFDDIPVVPGQIIDAVDQRCHFYEALVCLDKSTSFHYHDFDELVRVREGSGEIFMGPRSDAKINNVLYPYQVMRANIVPKAIIGVPRGCTHGFHVKGSLVLEAVCATQSYYENEMKFKVGKGEVAHEYFFTNRL